MDARSYLARPLLILNVYLRGPSRILHFLSSDFLKKKWREIIILSFSFLKKIRLHLYRPIISVKLVRSDDIPFLSAQLDHCLQSDSGTRRPKPTRIKGRHQILRRLQAALEPGGSDAQTAAGKGEARGRKPPPSCNLWWKLVVTDSEKFFRRKCAKIFSFRSGCYRSILREEKGVKLS